MDRREQIKAKVEKLMRLGTHEATPEHEAYAALRMAEKMMRAHGIEAAELADRTGAKPVYNWSTVNVPAGAPEPLRSPPLWFGWLVTHIGKFTDVKVGYSYPPGHGVCARLQGDAVDVEYAAWLVKHLRDNVRAAAATYNGTRADRESFRKAMVLRLGERMTALTQERRAALQQHKTSTGTALVLVDQKIVERDAAFGKQTYGPQRRVGIRYAAGTAGRAAADKVSLNRPLGQTGPRAALR